VRSTGRIPRSVAWVAGQCLCVLSALAAQVCAAEADDPEPRDGDQTNGRVAALLEHFRSDPVAHGWALEVDAADRENRETEQPSADPPRSCSTHTDWNGDHQSLKIVAHRCGQRRHRFVHPLARQNTDASFFGSIDFQISAFATDRHNAAVMGLFQADQPDDTGSLTLQIWDAKTVKVQLAGEAAAVTLVPDLAAALVCGPVYRFSFRYDPRTATLHATLHGASDPAAPIFEASVATTKAGRFAMDEFGVAMWNVDATTTEPKTAFHYRVLAFAFNRLRARPTCGPIPGNCATRS